MKKKYQKRDAIKNYFPLPNEIFGLELSAGEIATYSYLMFCENRKTYQCYPSYRTIGKAIGVSKNTAGKYVSGLEEKHLIMTEPTKIIRKDGAKRNGSLLYTILPIDVAIDYYNKKKLRELEEQVEIKKAREKFEKACVEESA